MSHVSTLLTCACS